MSETRELAAKHRALATLYDRKVLLESCEEGLQQQAKRLASIREELRAVDRNIASIEEVERGARADV